VWFYVYYIIIMPLEIFLWPKKETETNQCFEKAVSEIGCTRYAVPE
jgi:hypothetical protein